MIKNFKTFILLKYPNISAAAQAWMKVEIDFDDDELKSMNELLESARVVLYISSRGTRSIADTDTDMCYLDNYEFDSEYEDWE